jgi:hypothetical protein
MGEVSLVNQLVAAKRDVRAVHEAENCQQQQGSIPDSGASVCGGEAVPAVSA